MQQADLNPDKAGYSEHLGLHEAVLLGQILGMMGAGKRLSLRCIQFQQACWPFTGYIVHAFSPTSYWNDYCGGSKACLVVKKLPLQDGHVRPSVMKRYPGVKSP